MNILRMIKSFCLVMLVFVFICSTALAASTVQQFCSLSGTVAADGLAVVGMTVSEGQSLVQVKTVAGLAVAARANCSGKVTAVAVKPGGVITAGQMVVQIQP